MQQSSQLSPSGAPDAHDNQAFNRLLRQLPDDVVASFTPAQLTAIEIGLNHPGKHHRVDFRVSVPWFGSRYYIAFFTGNENRSLERLRREGQIAVGRVAGTYGAAMLVIGACMFLTATVCIYSVTKLFDDDSSGAVGYRQARR